ncbi:MAG: hypothetical protein RJQ14_10225 [Marinoscillum sp.]
MSRAKLIDYYIAESRNPNFQIDQIRKDLEKKGIADKEIKVIVRLVDNAIQNAALHKTTRNRSNELLIAGGVLTLIGAGITVGTYTGLINMGDSFLVVYGPFLGGASMVLGGLTRKRYFR